MIRNNVTSLVLGILGVLAFGVGLCCFLVCNLWLPGALACVLGVVWMLLAPVLYRRLVEKRKQQIAPEILRLTKELSRE